MTFISPYIYEPSPDLEPDEVVKIQLDALQNDDLTPDNAGVRAAFRFASPENREQTGPIDRFIRLVKNPLYTPLIGFERAEVGIMLILGDYAQQRVRVMNAKKGAATYVFTLSRQYAAPYEGCWMTDNVVREKE